MESESIALPLGDTPTGMGWIVGFEPTHNGATTRCLNHLTIPTAFVEATPGFEPGNKGFADLCLTTWLCRHISAKLCSFCFYRPQSALLRSAVVLGDPDQARTDDLQRDRLAF